MNRFLVVKYVRDLARMEPRNVGVIVWTPNGCDALFLGDTVDDERLPLPAFMSQRNQKVYKRWVDYWRDLLAKDAIHYKKGELITPKDERFLDVLLRSSRENYLVTKGGQIPRAVNDLRATTQQLFELFVSNIDEPAAVTESQELSQRWRNVVKQSKIGPVLDRKYSMTCDVAGITRHFQFDFKVGDGGLPSAVLQRALLLKPESANSATLMLMSAASVITRDRCAAIVYAPDELLQGNEQAQETLATLEMTAKVLNVANIEKAADELYKLAT